MKKSWLILFVTVCLLSLWSCGFCEHSPGNAGKAFTDVVLLTSTDMHGKCWHTNLLTGTPEKNNMLSLATAVYRFREKYGAEQTILIDNGDLFEGTPVSETQLAAITAGESQDPPAMALCLKEIGYDAFVLGNHEFNFDWDVMSSAYRYLEENGIAVLAANIFRDGRDEEHEAGSNAFTPWITKTITVNGHGHKIGILGLENTDISRWDLPSRYPGLRFNHPENTTCSIVVEAEPCLARMREEGCEFIIVSYHSGLGNEDKPLAFGENTTNQGLRLIHGTRDIDLLILGHDHTSGYSNNYYPNALGRNILVVNGGGQQLTKTIIRFRENSAGELVWNLTDSSNVDLGSYEPDSELETLIAPYAALASDVVNTPFGTASGIWDGSTDYYTRQTNTADLVSAALIEIPSRLLRNRYADPAATGITNLDHLDVDMSMSSILVSGQYVVQPGGLSLRDIYRIYRFPNSAMVIPMRGSQIRAVMEENASKRLTARLLNGEPCFYSVGDDNTHLIFGGLNFDYDLSRPDGERVLISDFSNGRPFRDDDLYLVTVNNFLLGNDRCGLRIFSEEDALWAQEEDHVQDLIAAYINEHSAKNELTPALFPWRWSVTCSDDPQPSQPDRHKAAARWVSTPEDGHTYMLRQEADGRTLTGSAAGDGLSGAVCPASGDVIPAPLDPNTLRFTLHALPDGSVALVDAGGRYLTATTGGGLELTDKIADDRLSLWLLRQVSGGWCLICAGTADSPAPKALQFYGNRFTTFEISSSGSFVFNFYEITDGQTK